MSLFPLRTAAPSVAGPARMGARIVVYILSVLVTAGTLWARLAVGYKAGDPLMLIVFLIPVLFSAYAGGLGPGLVATAVAAVETAYYLIPPLHSFAISSRVNVAQWIVLIVLGTLMSLLIESLRGARTTGEPWPAERARFSTEQKVQTGFAFALGVPRGHRSDVIFQRHPPGRGCPDGTAHPRGDFGGAPGARHDHRGRDSAARLSDYGRGILSRAIRQATQTMDANLEGLRKLTADNAAQQATIQLLAPQVAERMTILGDNIEQRRQAGFRCSPGSRAQRTGKTARPPDPPMAGPPAWKRWSRVCSRSGRPAPSGAAWRRGRPSPAAERWRLSLCRSHFS